jgi:hypothetical protein
MDLQTVEPGLAGGRSVQMYTLYSLRPMYGFLQASAAQGPRPAAGGGA